jgi:hypothetical protein
MSVWSMVRRPVILNKACIRLIAGRVVTLQDRVEQLFADLRLSALISIWHRWRVRVQNGLRNI